MVAHYLRPTGTGRIELVLAIECKGKSWPAWVLMMNGRQLASTDEAMLEVLPHNLQSLRGLRGAWDAPLLHLDVDVPSAYAVATAKDKPKDPEDSYQGYMQAVGAAHALLTDLGPTEPGHVRIVVPVVVTRAPLVSVRLDDAGLEHYQEVPRGLLVSRLLPGNGLQAVWIVHSDNLQAFAADARTSVDHLSVTEAAWTQEPLRAPFRRGLPGFHE